MRVNARLTAKATAKATARVAAVALGYVLILASGCVGAPVGGLSDADRAATLTVVPQFRGGGYHAQALVEPYAGTDVQHLVLSLYTVSGNTETAVTSNGSPVTVDADKTTLEQPLLFESLHFDTTYRVRAAAYKNVGTAADDLISVAASSLLDFAVADDDRPTVATLSIQLVDKTFNGQGTGSIGFTDGVLTDVGDEKVE